MTEDKRIPVSFRVSPRFKRCLELAAKHEQRSQTNLVEKLVFDFCKQNGLQPDAEEQQAVPAKRARKAG